MRILAVRLVALFSLAVAQVSYDGYKVYRVTATTASELDKLKALENDDAFDFWSLHKIPNIPVDVMVSPIAQDTFEAFLNKNGLNYGILNNNVGETILKENEYTRMSTRVTLGNVSFTEFMRHDEINAYLVQLAIRYPNIVKVEQIGTSFEGRNLTIIRISSGGLNKPTIFADAAIHAREWIAPSVALYVIYQLVEVPANSYLYQNVDWVFIPVANPDGYEYTHTTARMWRKTRSPGTVCPGADPNRNFGYHWGESGSSIWQCSDIFAGRGAFSEVETQALRDYLFLHKDDIKLYIAIHSYGNWILYPWSYAELLPDNADELHSVGLIFNDAVHAYNGSNYTVGNSAQLLYASAGCSDDYAAGGLNISLSYTLELPGGSTGGFNPPATDILSIVQETWEGWKAWQQYIENKFVNATAAN